MNPAAPLVFLVDDDLSVREGVCGLLRSAGYEVAAFADATSFCRQRPVDRPACLVLDVGLPDLNGLDLQTRLPLLHPSLPVIFITGQGDIPMTVRAMRAGAVEFLAKPFNDEALLSAVALALDQSRHARVVREERAAIERRYHDLTPRERQVLTLVTRGLLNKQIAASLGTSEITVKVQRGQVMKKMGADSFADLVRIAEKLGCGTPTP